MGFRSKDSLDDEAFFSMDPLTTRGRWCQFLGLAITPLVPCLGLIMYAAIYLSSTVPDYLAIRDVKAAMVISTAGLDVMAALHEEMDGAASVVASDGQEIIDTTTEINRRTDLRLAAFSHWSDLPKSLAQVQAELTHLRIVQLNKTTRKEVLDIMKSYTHTADLFINWITRTIDHDFSVEGMLSFFTYYQLLQCLRQLAVVKVLSVVAFLRGWLTEEERLMFADAEHVSIFNLNLATSLNDINGYLKEISFSNTYTHEFGLHDQAMEANNTSEPDLYATVISYRRLSSYYLGLIRLLQLEVDKIEQTTILDMEEQVRIIIDYSIILIFLGIIILPFIILAARHSVVSLYSYARIMERKAVEIKRERRKTENVLNEMLPRIISYRLRQGEKIPAEFFENVTVFFSDIEDFGEISSNSSPIDIVVFLNDIYNHMDKMMEEGYDVYKVETIGCVYMVVSGLPSRNGQRHASEIARLSLDLMRSTEKFVIPHLPDNMLQLRIGIHTGAVVAGVVGNKMPRYCLFGDTVNTASRIQSNGLARKIQMSHPTKVTLDKIGGFNSEERGVIAMKGKGTMKTYWLLSRDKRTSKGKFGLNRSSSVSSIAEPPIVNSTADLLDATTNNSTTDTMDGMNQSAIKSMVESTINSAADLLMDSTTEPNSNSVVQSPVDSTAE